MTCSRPRRGYAMMLTVVTLVLFLAVWSVAYRQTAAALRIETARVTCAQRDEGSVAALARAVTLLETGFPPTDPYVCGVSITTSTGSASYKVTFTATDANSWSLQAARMLPNETPVQMPSTFGPP